MAIAYRCCFFFSLVHLREALLELPTSELQRTDLAVIVPAFELRKGPDTSSFSDVADSLLR